MKKIKMKRSVATARGSLSKGDEIEVADALAESWVESGTADDITPKQASRKKATKADDESGDESS